MYESDAWHFVVFYRSVVLDCITSVGADDEEEGAGHVAFGVTDAGVEIEFAFLCTIEAHSVHDA